VQLSLNNIQSSYQSLISTTWIISLVYVGLDIFVSKRLSKEMKFTLIISVFIQHM